MKGWSIIGNAHAGGDKAEENGGDIFRNKVELRLVSGLQRMLY